MATSIQKGIGEKAKSKEEIIAFMAMSLLITF